MNKPAEEQLKTFIAKFDAKNQAFIRAVRRALKKRLPTANELVYDNYNFFVIGYCSTERASDAILSLAADANGMACTSTTVPDFSIRIRYCSARVFRIVSSGWSPSRPCHDLRSRLLSLLRSPKPRRPSRRAGMGNSSSVLYRQSRDPAENQPSNTFAPSC